jgi:hypothetical protein
MRELQADIFEVMNPCATDFEVILSQSRYLQRQI